MKKQLLVLILLLFVSMANAHISYVDIDPNEDDVFSLGDLTHRWRAYLSVLDVNNLTGVLKATSGNVSVVGSPVKNYVLMYNGSAPVWAAAGTTFTFSIATFTNTGGTTTALIGGSTTAWKTAGAITFSATYNNGPPTSATVAVTGTADNPAALNMGAPNYTGPTATIEDLNYPASNGGRITYTLSATDGTDPDTEIAYSPYFYNHFVYDDLTKNTGFTDSDIDAMAAANEIISNTTARTFTLSIDAANYLCFAHRTGDTAVAQVRCGTGDNLITVAMNKNDATAVTPLKETVSHSNLNGKTENFYVYASKLQNIDAHSTSFTTTTSTTAQNYLYYGKTDEASGWDESDVEALNTQVISSNVHTRVWTAQALDDDYLLIAFPSRLSTPGFKDNTTGFGVGMESPAIVTVTNVCGFQEDYEVYRSTQKLTSGSFVLETY